MIRREILRQIPDLPPQNIYIYALHGFIKPTHVENGHIKNWIFSEEDFKIIQSIWEYTKKGHSKTDSYIMTLRELYGEKRASNYIKNSYPKHRQDLSKKSQINENLLVTLERLANTLERGIKCNISLDQLVKAIPTNPQNLLQGYKSIMIDYKLVKGIKY